MKNVVIDTIIILIKLEGIIKLQIVICVNCQIYFLLFEISVSIGFFQTAIKQTTEDHWLPSVIRLTLSYCHLSPSASKLFN